VESDIAMMTAKIREAARKAARLQWMAERYRQQGKRNDPLNQRAEHLAQRLEAMAASTLCRGFERPAMAHGDV